MNASVALWILFQLPRPSPYECLPVSLAEPAPASLLADTARLIECAIPTVREGGLTVDVADGPFVRARACFTDGSALVAYLGTGMLPEIGVVHLTPECTANVQAAATGSLFPREASSRGQSRCGSYASLRVSYRGHRSRWMCVIDHRSTSLRILRYAIQYIVRALCASAPAHPERSCSPNRPFR